MHLSAACRYKCILFSLVYWTNNVRFPQQDVWLCTVKVIWSHIAVLLFFLDSKYPAWLFDPQSDFLKYILHPLEVIATEYALMWTGLLQVGFDRITRRKMSTVVSASRIMWLAMTRKSVLRWRFASLSFLRTLRHHCFSIPRFLRVSTGCLKILPRHQLRYCPSPGET